MLAELEILPLGSSGKILTPLGFLTKACGFKTRKCSRIGFVVQTHFSGACARVCVHGSLRNKHLDTFYLINKKTVWKLGIYCSHTSESSEHDLRKLPAYLEEVPSWCILAIKSFPQFWSCLTYQCCHKYQGWITYLSILTYWCCPTYCGCLTYQNYLTYRGCLTYWDCLTYWGCLTYWDYLTYWCCITY